jgi:uroporphyrinogen decarboxylase
MVINDCFIRACRHKQAKRTPIWLMRQAGRYMEEYRQLRSKYTFLQMCQTPELAAEITLQPLKIFDLDAAIIFSDILLPLEKLGVSVTFVDSTGPVLNTSINTIQDVENLYPVEADTHLPYLIEAIGLVRRELDGKVPLIGFSGAPFTLASYLIEGGGSKGFQRTKTLMYREPRAFHLLMEKLCCLSIKHLNSQIDGGVEAVQVFDSWIGTLSIADYREFVFPYMKKLFTSLDSSVPSIHFGVGSFHLLDLMAKAGGDVMGVDWRVPIDEAWKVIGFDKAIQGNLDPMMLFGSPEYLVNQTNDVLSRTSGRTGHIFNLGHGVPQGAPIEMVRLLIDTVHAYEIEK